MQRTIKGWIWLIMTVEWKNVILLQYEILFLLFFAIQKFKFMYAFVNFYVLVDTMQAFRRLYEQVGLGWVYAITKYEPVSLPIILWRTCSVIVKHIFPFGFTAKLMAGVCSSCIMILMEVNNIHRLGKLLILFMVFGLNTVFKLQVNAKSINDILALKFPRINILIVLSCLYSYANQNDYVYILSIYALIVHFGQDGNL